MTVSMIIRYKNMTIYVLCLCEKYEKYINELPRNRFDEVVPHLSPGQSNGLIPLFAILARVRHMGMGELRVKEKLEVIFNGCRHPV